MQELLGLLGGIQPIFTFVALLVLLTLAIYLAKKIIKWALLTVGAGVVLAVLLFVSVDSPVDFLQIMLGYQEPALKVAEEFREDIDRRLQEKGKEILFDLVIGSEKDAAR